MKIIGLCVLSENESAIALYEQLGFKRYGTEPKHYLMVVIIMMKI